MWTKGEDVDAEFNCSVMALQATLGFVKLREVDPYQFQMQKHNGK